MGKHTAKQEREREVFGRFAAVSDLSIEAGSIQSCEKPQPDIRCRIEGEGNVWFELAEACSEDMARAINTLPESGVFATWPGENTEETVSKHIGTQYKANGPMELLVYDDGRSPNSESGLIASIEYVVQSGAGQFRRVWFLGESGAHLVWSGVS